MHMEVGKEILSRISWQFIWLLGRQWKLLRVEQQRRSNFQGQDFKEKFKSKHNWYRRILHMLAKKECMLKCKVYFCSRNQIMSKTSRKKSKFLPKQFLSLRKKTRAEKRRSWENLEKVSKLFIFSTIRLYFAFLLCLEAYTGCKWCKTWDFMSHVNKIRFKMLVI